MVDYVRFDLGRKVTINSLIHFSAFAHFPTISMTTVLPVSLHYLNNLFLEDSN